MPGLQACRHACGHALRPLLDEAVAAPLVSPIRNYDDVCSWVFDIVRGKLRREDISVVRLAMNIGEDSIENERGRVDRP